MAGSWSCSISAVLLIFMHYDLSGIKSFIKMINHGIQNKFILKFIFNWLIAIPAKFTPEMLSQTAEKLL